MPGNRASSMDQAGQANPHHAYSARHDHQPRPPGSASRLPGRLVRQQLLRSCLKEIERMLAVKPRQVWLQHEASDDIPPMPDQAPVALLETRLRGGEAIDQVPRVKFCQVS